jgi:hypothetical protein
VAGNRRLAEVNRSAQWLIKRHTLIHKTSFPHNELAV